MNPTTRNTSFLRRDDQIKRAYPLQPVNLNVRARNVGCFKEIYLSMSWLLELFQITVPVFDVIQTAGIIVMSNTHLTVVGTSAAFLVSVNFLNCVW